MSEKTKQTSDKQQNGNDFIADVSNWVAVKDALPQIDTFYLVANSKIQKWTKALYRLSEFHTIEDIGEITHWRYIKPPCC